MLLARKKIDYSTKEASKSTSVRKNIFFNLSTNIFLIRTLLFTGISKVPETQTAVKMPVL
jgi:hypothetical protein